MGVFGAQQSVLESVLLKRKIMGPSWISLHCPTRVDASRQASQPSPYSRLHLSPLGTNKLRVVIPSRHARHSQSKCLPSKPACLAHSVKV